MTDILQQLMHKKVDVIYRGVCYRGVLVGTDEDAIHLQTDMDWVVLPMGEIADVRAAPS